MWAACGEGLVSSLVLRWLGRKVLSLGGTSFAVQLWTSPYDGDVYDRRLLAVLGSLFLEAKSICATGSLVQWCSHSTK